MSNQNLPVIENPTVNLPSLTNPQEVMEILEENMAGQTPEFARVKIPSGGGLAFEVPGDNPDEPDTERELVGVILDHYPVNAYWQNNYSGENNAPDCSSMDGKVGHAPEGSPVKWAGGMQDCASCPFNQWGSGEGGFGKACKNMHRVYILREGEIFPLLLTLPPTSVKNLTSYMARLSGKLKRFYGVVTKIRLKKAQSKGGIEYSQATFAKHADLSPEEVKAMKQLSAQLKGAMREVSIEATETDYEAPRQEVNEEDIM